MKVREMCQRRVVTALVTDELVTAARLMRDQHVGFLVIVESAAHTESAMRLVGVLTDRDIVVSVIGEGLTPASLKVGDVMTRRPATIMNDDSITDALEQMRHVGVRRLPVIGEHGELIGVLSIDDVLGQMARDMGHAAGAIATERDREITQHR